MMVLKRMQSVRFQQYYKLLQPHGSNKLGYDINFVCRLCDDNTVMGYDAIQLYKNKTNSVIIIYLIYLSVTRN